MPDSSGTATKTRVSFISVEEAGVRKLSSLIVKDYRNTIIQILIGTFHGAAALNHLGLSVFAK